MPEYPAIQEARECAWSRLKPGAQDRDHGLELHRQSLVFESYGFGPYARSDQQAAAQLAAIQAGASALEQQDRMEDLMMTGYLYDPAQLAEFMAYWEASGVTGLVRNAGEEHQDPGVVLKRLARYTQVTDRLRGFLDKALTPADVVRAKREGRHALCLTTNAVPLVRQGVSAEDELRALRTFFQLGVRMMHLTYNRRNLLGDGCAEAANGGLSDFGRAVIAEMNRLGLLVDVAHSGWQTSLEAARASARPIVASHTVCAALNPHARAKPDEVIRAIVDGGGLVGICAIPAFLGGNGDITALLDHVDYVKRTFGADAVAIGTDVSASLSLPEADRAPARALAAARPKARPKFENFWRPDEPMNRPEWNRPEQHLSLSWLNFPCFTVGMVQRGYADDDIRKILGGNMLRVLEAVLPEPEKRRLV